MWKSWGLLELHRKRFFFSLAVSATTGTGVEFISMMFIKREALSTMTLLYPRETIASTKDTKCGTSKIVDEEVSFFIGMYLKLYLSIAHRRHSRRELPRAKLQQTSTLSQDPYRWNFTFNWITCVPYFRFDHKNFSYGFQNYFIFCCEITKSLKLLQMLLVQDQGEHCVWDFEMRLLYMSKHRDWDGSARSFSSSDIRNKYFEISKKEGKQLATEKCFLLSHFFRFSSPLFRES